MKILFVYSSINCICTTKCCFELSRALKKYADTEVVSYKLLTNDIVQCFDIIILQRIGDGEFINIDDRKFIIKLIKENRNKKYIYLVDDLIIEVQDGLPKELAALCDAVMCSSEKLCDNLRKINKDVYRFSTFIDCSIYDAVKVNLFKNFTLAWVSNSGLGIDLINGIIEKINLMNLKFNLIAISGQSNKLKKSNCLKCYGIIPEINMINIIKGSHILLNPMTVNNRFNSIIKAYYKEDVSEFINSKAEIKYLTAGMCHSCLLTSDIECYRKSVVNGINGFILSDDIDEWITSIIKLYNDRYYLDTIIKNAYQDVKKNYDINIVAKDIYIKLEKIMNENKIT